MNRTVDAWLSFLLPLRCLGCSGAIPAGEATPVCPACRTRLAPLPSPQCITCGTPGFSTTETVAPGRCALCEPWPENVIARSATAMITPGDRLVHAFKYEGWEQISGLLGRRLAQTVPSDWNGDAIAPVPTTPRRLRERGFNPAERLARALGSVLGLPVIEALCRPREAPRQVGLPPDQRSANVRDAFSPDPGFSTSIRDQKVILVDDVLTTGATAIEAARTLGSMGASSVLILTFARALPQRPDEFRQAS